MEPDLKSEASYIEDTLLDLLSEDGECILLKRASRKTAWNKQKPKSDIRKKNLDKLQEKVDKIKQCEITSSLLVDNGHRSLERVKKSPVRSPRQHQLVRVSSDAKGRQQRQRVKKNLDSNSLCDISEQGFVQMIKWSIGDKDEAMLKTLVGQIKKLDEKVKSRILNKLTFDERLLVIKTLYARPNKPNKIVATVISPSTLRRHTVDKKLTDRNSPKSSSVNRVSFTPRKSFSYLDHKSEYSEPYSPQPKPLKHQNIELDLKPPRIPSKSPVLRNGTPHKEEAYKMMSQINELQRQNSKLSSTVNHLITKNYKLEQKLEVEKEDNPKMQHQMDSLTTCHDSIIDNIYAAYSQLTRRLKSLKFSSTASSSRKCIPRSHSLSRTPVTNILQEKAARIRDRARSVSLSPVQSRSPSPVRTRETDAKRRIDSFMCDRKVELTHDYHTTDLKLDRIDKLLISEPVGSSLYKKCMLEKKLLREHKDALRKMIESI